MRVGLVNNMPDAALEETERQFLRLVRPAMAGWDLQLNHYWMPGVERSADRASRILAEHLPVEALRSDPPDALIVTGTVPRCADLRDEPYWEPLTELLGWAERSVPVTLLSCLASHGALLTLDGITRHPLPVKLSGVFAQHLHPSHRLVDGLSAVAFPHSRLNDVPTARLVEHGYVILVEAEETGWTVAARERDGRLMMLLQGHPEYSPTTLLREYRRDVRQFLEGSTANYPHVPDGYLDAAGAALLEQFRQEAEQRGRRDMVDFPFVAAASHIRVDWQHHSERLLHNVLADARRRTLPHAIEPPVAAAASRVTRA